MRRLIYAPKVYIFIRSSNMNGTVYDVSADVTSGSVTQKLGDLSTANWTLRNRYRKWIRDPDSNQQIFLPMDMVTIWLQRIAGRPIQVFTGYLNEVPYYQAYPGDAIFSASCTLKKLAFTWFDPGLPFFQQWVDSNSGWIITSDGNAINPQYLTPTQSGNNAPITGTKTSVSDGGFGELLGRFLVEVAGWANEDVLISDLPKHLPKLAARLYADVNKNSMSDLQNLEKALAQVMSVGGWQNPNAQTSDTAAGPAQDPQTLKVVKTAKQACDAANVPLLACTFAALVQTNLDPAFDTASSKQDPMKAQYGLYGMLPNGQDSLGSPGASAGPGEPTIDGTLVSDIVGDAFVATQIICKRINQYPDLKKAAQKNSLDAIVALIEKVLGQKLPSTRSLQTLFNTAKQYSATSYTSAGNNSPASSVDPGSLTFKDPKVLGLLSAREKQIVTTHYNNTKPWLAGILWRAKQDSQKITIAVPAGKIGASTIALTGPSAALTQFFGHLSGDQTVDKVDAVIDGVDRVLVNGSPSSASGTPGANNVMAVTQATQPTNSTTSSSTSSTTSGQAGLGQTVSDFVTLSANAAFAAQFAFPANVTESLYLTGNRALMNDVSCLDGVKQFCQASMRTFRSLPDGRFLAFYPDYFGATRKPYWQIYNIEMTNFGIQLNDQELATHVYVVGDTFGADGQIDWHDMVSTRGVATVTQAFMLNSFIEPWTPTDPNTPLQQPQIGKQLEDAFSFLQHYGARPYEEDQPLIRNVFYEFLIAWQRFMQKWSALFATECTFTFQPEVMAGGLISFPDHKVQMFCQEVTHTFDYTNGFETQAVLTAPSLASDKRKDRLAFPGFALAGNVNTVGV